MAAVVPNRDQLAEIRDYVQNGMAFEWDHGLIPPRVVPNTVQSQSRVSVHVQYIQSQCDHVYTAHDHHCTLCRIYMSTVQSGLH